MIWIIELSTFQISKLPDMRIFKFLNFCILVFPNFSIIGRSIFQISEFLISRGLEFPNFQYVRGLHVRSILRDDSTFGKH